MKHLRAQSKARTHAKLARWMGGQAGAKVKDEMEDGKPKAKRATSEPISVEGKAARPRLDRPGRKMGGSIKRAEGGPAWIGEGDSGKPMKEEAARKKKASIDAAGDSILTSGLAAASGLGAALARGKLRGLGAASTLINGAAAKMGMDRSVRARKEADIANKAGDEVEGRKRGGKV